VGRVLASRARGALEFWHCPQAVGEEPKVGGIFTHTFAAKDGMTSFDFSGRYDEVEPMRRIQYTLGDASEVFTPSTRSVETTFTPVPSGVEVVQIFDTEDSHTLEQQKAGWAAVLEHFRQYVESI